MPIDTTLSLTDRVAASFHAYVAEVVADADVVPATAGPNGGAVAVLQRSVANMIPARDGCPVVIVTRTPGRTEREEPKLRHKDVYTPMAAIICEPSNQSAAGAGTPWVGKLRDMIKWRLNRESYEALPEFRRAIVDEAALIDTTLWDQANIRAVMVPVVIFCRVALPYA